MARPDLSIIETWVPDGARVLDLGCGDGTLLAHLQRRRGVTGYGLEIDPDQIQRCIQKGINVIHADLERGLADFADDAFDFVVVSQTLQAVHHTENLLDEMLRVGRQGIVTFPNFGLWRCRWQLLWGHMPVVTTLPYAWYNTPNIHLFTIADFERLCRQKPIAILERRVGGVDGRSWWGTRLWP
ncbi:MAG: methionine biosynthesis protein MetW, partial [Candidatus Competibacterales bacterium]